MDLQRTIWRIAESKTFWTMAAFVPSLFLPWRTIYKGTMVFAVLPLWWEYFKPQENILVIGGHVFCSVVIGWLISSVMRWIRTK
jgi:hypothetical protein